MTHSQPLRPSNRIRIFVDYWNLQLTMNERLNRRFNFDWVFLPEWLAERAADICSLREFAYDGMHVYASYNPDTEGGNKHRSWMETFLAKQPGIQVVIKRQQIRGSPPYCRHCKTKFYTCPSCHNNLDKYIEKGVDTALVTSMISLASERVYDIAILVSSDADLIPAVEYLNMRGLKVLQAGFPPAGSALATACWASFDLLAGHTEFEFKAR